MATYGGICGQARPEIRERAMQVIDSVTATWEPDPWLTLQGLSQYSGLSVRTLRAYLVDPDHPLPHYRMKESHAITTRAGKRQQASGKILVRRSEFDRWMAAFRAQPALDLDRLVDEMVAGVKDSSPTQPDSAGNVTAAA